jgi:hypothetical protein
VVAQAKHRGKLTEGLLLGQNLKPRVGDAAFSFTLSRTH